MSVGLVLGVRGILGKELRSRTRGYWRPMLLLTIYLSVVAVAVVAVLGISVSASGTLSPNLGQSLFTALASGSVLLIAFIAPGLTSGTISGERERRTLDLLLVTRASPLGLVAGKLAGALLWVLYLLIGSLPAMAIVNLFGGVPLAVAAASISVAVATAISYSALGLLLSALVRRTVLATVLAYAVVLVTVIVLPIVNLSLRLVGDVGGFFFPPAGGAFGVTLGNTPDTPPLGLPPANAWPGFMSPVSALISTLGGSPGLFGSPTLGRVGPLSAYVSRQPTPGVPAEFVTSLAPWAFYCVLSVLFAILAMLLAAFVLRPAPAWRSRRAGARGN